MHPQRGHGAGGAGPDYGAAPLVLTWEVTRACDLACDHCRADAETEPAPGELSTAEGEAFLEQVAGFGDRTPILVFSGGDPLKRPDLFHLAAHADDLGLATAVTPASTPLLTRAAIERFVDVGVRRMALSLDGATAETHDAFRGEAGSFDAIARAAEDAREVGLSLQINTTVTAATVDDLPAIADLVESMGAVMWEVFFLVPVGRGAALEGLDPAESDEVMAWLYRRGRDAPFRVITVEAPHYRRVATQVAAADGDGPVRVGSTRAGHGFLFVGHAGDVYPSGFLPRRVGTVPEDDVVERYRESPFLRTLRDPDGFSGRCGACEFRHACGGSRSRAYAHTGDPLASDPLCPYPASGADA